MDAHAVKCNFDGHLQDRKIPTTAKCHVVVVDASKSSNGTYLKSSLHPLMPKKFFYDGRVSRFHYFVFE